MIERRPTMQYAAPSSRNQWNGATQPTLAGPLPFFDPAETPLLSSKAGHTAFGYKTQFVMHVARRHQDSPELAHGGSPGGDGPRPRRAPGRAVCQPCRAAPARA